MAEEKKPGPEQRRRFLRESVRGSLPLMLDWVAGRARSLTALAHTKPEPPKSSAPPQGAEEAPAGAKEKLDLHYQEFARDNAEDEPSS